MENERTDRPTKFGSYRITQWHGEGPLALVGTAQRDGNVFLLKALHEQAAGLRKTFWDQSERLQSRLDRQYHCIYRQTTSISGFAIHVYPWLNPRKWRPLSEWLTGSQATEAFAQACLAIDLIHICGLVHRDLRIDHILLHRRGRSFAVRIIDFDFLVAAGPADRQTLAGARHFLPPEAVTATEFEPSYDLYTFAKSVQALALDLPESTAAIIRDCARESSLERPQSMWHALHRHGGIDETRSRHHLERTTLALARTQIRFPEMQRSESDPLAAQLVFPTATARDVVADWVAARPAVRYRSLRRVLPEVHIKRSSFALAVVIPAHVLGQLLARSDSSSDKMRQIIASLSERSDGDTSNLLADAGWQLRLGYLNEGERTLTAIAESEDHPVSRRLHCWQRAVTISLLRFNIAAARAYLVSGQTLANSAEDTSYRLEFRRLAVWVGGLMASPERAIDTLRRLLREARAEGDSILQARLHHDLGVAHGQLDRHRSASRHLARAHALAVEIRQSDWSPFGILSSIVRLAYQRGDCELADRVLMSARSESELPEDELRRGMLGTYESAVAADSGDYQRALDASERCRASSGLETATVAELITLNNDLELAKIRRQSDLARFYMTMALRQLQLDDGAAMRPLVILNAAELLVSVDDSDGAIELLESLSDDGLSPAFRLRKRLIHVLASASTSVSADHVREFITIYREARQHAHYRLMARSAFWLLALAPQQARTEISFSDIESISRSGVLGAAVQALMAAEPRVGVAAVRKLRKSPYPLHEIVLLDKVAHWCRDSEQLILSRKYHSLARQSANRWSASGIPTFGLLTEGKDDESPIEARLSLTLLRGVRRIMDSENNEEAVLRGLLQLALSVSGAERVALFSVNTDNVLSLRLSLNLLDPDSIGEDLVSSGTAHYALRDDRELLIDNAQADPRTASLTSVLTENIQSILCLPITVQRQRRHVLYLDHHDLPKRFDEPDIERVRELAHMAGSLLSRSHVLPPEEPSRDFDATGIITRNADLQEQLRLLTKIAPTNHTVLVVGESGTGKELFARFIHEHSERADRDLIVINCATLTESLADAELFGIRKNVASGVDARPGAFEVASGSTLFLDEIGDMPTVLLPKLLRVLEEKTVRPIGSHLEIPVDTRIIAATNRSLHELQQGKDFRGDVFYRLTDHIVKLFPLRERVEDIPVLAEYFLRKATGDESRKFASDALDRLVTHPWPGNVRELKSVVRRAVLFSGSQIIHAVDLKFSDDETTGGSSAQIQHMTDDQRRAFLTKRLIALRGNVAELAREIDYPYSRLRRMLIRLEIPYRRF